MIEITIGNLDNLVTQIAEKVANEMHAKNNDALSVEQFITIKEACDLLHVTQQTLLTYRKRYNIPSKIIGGKVLFLREDLLNAMADYKLICA